MLRLGRKKIVEPVHFIIRIVHTIYADCAVLKA